MWRLLILPLLLEGCWTDETVSGYAGGVFVLEEMRGGAVSERVTISFPEEGAVVGEAPCNGYRARQGVPYPWIQVEGLVATKRACPALDVEAAYFAALRAATLVEASGGVLILSDDAGELLVFRQE